MIGRTFQTSDTQRPSSQANDSRAREVDHFLVLWNTEMLSLYNKRMREYCMLPFSMMTCISSDDLADVQGSFLETLQADYRQAADRLGSMMSAEWAAAQQTGDAYAETLLKAQKDAGAILDQAKAQAKRIVAEAESRAKSANGSDKASAAA